jgi:hypothetical protein
MSHVSKPIGLTVMSLLTLCAASHAEPQFTEPQFTAMLKCAGGKPDHLERYIGLAPTWLGAVKNAITKAEKDGWIVEALDTFGRGECYSINVTPKPWTGYGCNTKYCVGNGRPLTMSRVSKPIGLSRHTADLILLYLTAINRPARTSEVRQAVVNICPESASPIYGCLGDLLTAGRVNRLTVERDALLTLS